MNSKATWHLSLVILFLAAVLFSSSANAKGLFAHAEIGRSNISEDLDTGTGVVPVDESATGFRLAAGYEVTDYFSIEGGYIDFGTVDFSAGIVSGNAEADGLEFALIGRIPIGDRISLTGRAGYMWWDAKVSVLDLASTESDRNSLFGVGAEFRATDSFAITAGWSRYKLDSTDIECASIGVLARFGTVN